MGVNHKSLPPHIVEKDHQSETEIPSEMPVQGCVVVFAKCPIPGKSKTRLIPLLGEEGSVRLAKGMLSDVLKTIDGCVSMPYMY